MVVVPLDIPEIRLKPVCSATYDTDDDTSWCLLESQDWVGSDIIRPNCTTDATDPSCNDPINVSPDDERLANLYGDDVVRGSRHRSCFLLLIAKLALQ